MINKFTRQSVFNEFILNGKLITKILELTKLWFF